MSKLQDILSQTMAAVGAVVEKVASKVDTKGGRSATPKRTGVTDEEGQDFAAIQWEDKHIQALLAGAERTKLFPLIPALGDKLALHLTPAAVDYVSLLEKRGGQDIVELDVQKSSALVDRPEAKEHRLARGSVDKLPFKDKTFDFVMYPSALAWRADLPLLIPEMVRVLKDNGRFVISVVHPFFEYLMNPRGGFRNNIGELFTEMKSQGFFVDELKEATLDETLRIVSLPPKLNKDLKRFQGMPILLLLRGILVRKKK
jgi:SAM-dependent methyltransferase